MTLHLAMISEIQYQKNPKNKKQAAKAKIGTWDYIKLRSF